MITLAACGALAGAGIATLVGAVRPRPMALGRALAQLEASVPQGNGARTGSGWRGRAVRLAAPVAGRLGERTTGDLAVVGRPATAHAVEKLGCAVAMLVIGVALSLTLDLGGVAVPPVVAVLLALTGAAVGYVVPDVTLRSAAAARRSALRHALSSYLDLVNVLLAGGAGVETALQAAADAGDGWAFGQLRATVVRARSTRRSPWDCFAELGRQLAVDELVELAASVRLAGEHGARISLSLSAKAAAMRAHHAATIEADANAATERMGVPTVVMFLGFMVLLGYPAVQQIVGSL